MNTEQTHTPGPWAHDKSEGSDWGWIRDERGLMVAVCGIPEGEDLLRHRRNKTDPTECNARLISAAPELLEALKAIVAFDTPLPCGLLQQARSAIAKAEGKA